MWICYYDKNINSMIPSPINSSGILFTICTHLPKSSQVILVSSARTFQIQTRWTPICCRLFEALSEAVTLIRLLREDPHIKCFVIVCTKGKEELVSKTEVIMGSLWCGTWKCSSTSSSPKSRGCPLRLHSPHCHGSCEFSEGDCCSGRSGGLLWNGQGSRWLCGGGRRWGRWRCHCHRLAVRMEGVLGTGLCGTWRSERCLSGL